MKSGRVQLGEKWTVRKDIKVRPQKCVCGKRDEISTDRPLSGPFTFPPTQRTEYPSIRNVEFVETEITERCIHLPKLIFRSPKKFTDAKPTLTNIYSNFIFEKFGKSATKVQVPSYRLKEHV